MRLDKDRLKALVDMMKTPGWAVLQEVVREYKDKLSARVAPLARDRTLPAEKLLAEQNYILGRVVGMDFFIKTPDELMKQLEAESADSQ